MAGFHPVRQLAPAALNAGLRADSCRSSLRNQAAEVDPFQPLRGWAAGRLRVGGLRKGGNAPFEWVIVSLTSTHGCPPCGIAAKGG